MRWHQSLVSAFGKKTLIALAVITTVGLGLRVDAAIHPNPNPADDSYAYFALSKALYEDGSFGDSDFRDSSDWSPGAPWLYAGAYSLSGEAREGTARSVEALLGAASIIVTFLLAWRIGGRGPALLTAAGVAIYPPFIHSVGELSSEPPAMLTLPAAVLTFLWASTKSNWWPWLLPGFLMGLTAMFRPEYLAVALAFVAILATTQWRNSGWRPALTGVTVFLVALLLPILPWTVRNYVVLDKVVPISSGGGKALFVGTFYPADGNYQRVKSILYERKTGITLDSDSEALERVDPTPLFDQIASKYPDLDRDSALGRVGKENLQKWFELDPVGYIEMMVRKVGRMWSSGAGGTMDGPLTGPIQVLIVLLGMSGLAFLFIRRIWLEGALFAAPILTISLVGAVTLAATRRNEVLMTLIFPLASLVLPYAFGCLRSRLSSSSQKRFF